MSCNIAGWGVGFLIGLTLLFVWIGYRQKRQGRFVGWFKRRDRDG